MIYVIPNFQNPSGRTWSLERRKKLMELANKYDVAVLEDNAYGELIYEGERLPSLKSMDTEGRVIYLGSFSKILSPGLRVAWICATSEICAKLELIKYGLDSVDTTSALSSVSTLFSFIPVRQCPRLSPCAAPSRRAAA